MNSYLSNGMYSPLPPTDISTEECLKKFDGWRERVLPQIITHVQSRGPQHYQTIARLNEQWDMLYHGPEGLARMYAMRNGRVFRLPPDVLRSKIDKGEDGALQVGESYLAEYRRLVLKEGLSLTGEVQT